MRDDDDMTPGEIGRQVVELKLAIREGFAHVNDRLDRYLLRDVYQSDRAHQDRRLDALEKARTEDQHGTRWAVTAWLSAAAIVVSLAVGVIALFVK